MNSDAPTPIEWKQISRIGAVGAAAAADQPGIQDAHALQVRQRERCRRSAAASFAGAGVGAAMFQLGQQVRRQGRDARPLEQLDQRQVDVERAQDPVLQLRQHQRIEAEVVDGRGDVELLRRDVQDPRQRCRSILAPGARAAAPAPARPVQRAGWSRFGRLPRARAASLIRSMKRASRTRCG